MAERRWSRASVRVRTTTAAVLVVAVALTVAAVVLVGLVRGSLRDGLETTAEQRASDLADQIEASGLPDPPPTDDDDDDLDDDDLDELVWQVTDATGTVVRASQPLDRALPTDGYLVVTEDATGAAGEYVVSVAVS